MRSCSKWRSPAGGSRFIVITALSLAFLAPSPPAHAQSGDAGANAPVEPTEPAEDPHAGTAPAAAPPPGLKTLDAAQRLPENLQGWMRERQRRNPALVERRALATPPPAQPALAQQQANDDPEVDVLKRRLRSFDEGGVTVLSNRRERAEPVAPALTRVAAAAAVRPAPAAEPAPEAELEEPATETASVTTRSLRAQPARSTATETTPRWPAWLALSAALGLGVIWLRKRRATS